MMPPLWKTELQKTVEETVRADRENRKTQQNDAAAKIAGSLEAISNAQDRQTTHQDSSSKKNLALNIVTIGLVFLTVYFTYKSWRTFKAQLTEMHTQTVTAANTLIATERPWLDLKNIMVDDICIDPNGARVVVEFDLINMGHSPALRVEPWAASTIALQGAPDQRGLFVRPPVGGRDTQQSDIISPDNLPHHRQVSSYVFNSQLKWLQDKKIGIFPVRTDVCVDYGFEGSDRYPHQTCYALTPVQKPGMLITAPTSQSCSTNVQFSYGLPGESLAN
jgi:hypothetical protein